MRMSFRIPNAAPIAALITALVGSAARPAIAQPSTAAAPAAGSESEATTRARELLKQGVAAIDAHKWVEARRLLSEAFELRRSYDIAAALGQAEIELRRYRDAAEHLTFAVTDFPPGESRDLLAAVQGGLAKAKKHVGTVRVTTVPAARELLVDQQVVATGSLPAEIFVEPGSHVIAARFENDTRAEHTLIAQAGSSYTVELTAPPADAAPAADPAVAAGSTTTSSAPPDYGTTLRREKSLVPVIVGASLTGIGAAVAIGFGLAADSDRDDANGYKASLGPNGCSGADAATRAADCEAADDAYSSQRRNAVIANVGLGVGIAAGVATVAYVLFWPSKTVVDDSAGSSASRRWSLQPSVDFDRNSAGLRIDTSF